MLRRLIPISLLSLAILFACGSAQNEESAETPQPVAVTTPTPEPVATQEVPNEVVVPTHEALMGSLLASDTQVQSLGDCAFLQPEDGRLGTALATQRDAASATEQSSSCEPRDGGFRCTTDFRSAEEGTESLVRVSYETNDAGAIDFASVECLLAG